MGETITVEFTEQDKKDLVLWKKAVEEATTPSEDNMTRHRIQMPEVSASTPRMTESLEEALDEGKPVRMERAMKLDPQIIEGAKAAFTASGGNISEVAALYDLTPDTVMKLAHQEQWPIYGGGTKAVDSKSHAQLRSLAKKLWKRIEVMLDAMDVEQKKKDDITQHRLHSEYVEPLSSRSSAFKTLMDQYMRVMTILEPETFAVDTDGTNIHARRAKDSAHPGGIEGVNRELANFFSEVVIGVADRARERSELDGYGQIIDLGNQ